MYKRATQHDTDVNDNMYACVTPHDAHSTEHSHWAPCTVLIVILISSTHLAQVWVLHFHTIHIVIDVCGLFTLTSSLYFLLFLPSLFLFLFLFLINKKFMANLYNSAKEGVDHQRRPLLPHRSWAQGPWLPRASELAGAPLLHDPNCGPGLRRLYTRGYALSSTSSASRSLSTRRFVCQSVVVVNVR